MELLERNITSLLLSKIEKEQIVVLTGARQTGKTTLCGGILTGRLNMPYTYVSFDDPDERLRFQNSGITILESVTSSLVILDEVQKIPILFEHLKYVVDKRKRVGSAHKNVFVLTGSSQLVLLRHIKETIAGRVSLMNLYPFSLSEILRSEKQPCISKIWKEKTIRPGDVRQFNLIAPESVRTAISMRNEHLKWGGYPPVWQRDKSDDKFNWLKDYRRTYLERDISDVGQVANIDSFVIVQKLLCARTGNLLSLSEVAKDASLAVNTVKRYVSLLSMSFQCHLVSPYYENVGKRFVKSPKIYFPDPGVNRVVLGEMSISSGASYESWVFSELIKWRQLVPIEPEIYFYRTSSGMEIDFLITGEDSILPVEVKFSEKISPADGRSLEQFLKEKEKIAKVGIIIYPGKELKEIRKNVWAIPDWYLFTGMCHQ
jgi:predicted AAA+ superfamily ATPase